VLRNNYLICEELIKEYDKHCNELEPSASVSVSKISLSSKNMNDHSPFFLAVIKGHLDVAELLLKNDPGVIETRDREEDTPLHWAVMQANAKIIEFLLQRGHPIDQKNHVKASILKYRMGTPLS